MKKNSRIFSLCMLFYFILISMLLACGKQEIETNQEINTNQEITITQEITSETEIIPEKDDRIISLIKRMTVSQKIAQMMMVDFRYWDESGSKEADFTVMNTQVSDFISEYDLGSIIYFAQNLKDTKQAFDLSIEFQRAAMKDNGIPLFICTDQEGGLVNRLGGGTAMPGNMALGAIADSDIVKETGEIIGSELKSVGINVDFAPVVDINSNANNPVIGLRSYSDDAQTVGDLANAFIDGLAEYNVIGCLKHFPGHGDTETDSHNTLPSVNKSLDELRLKELKPYYDIMEHGVDMVMVAHVLYPQLDNGTVHSSKTGQNEKIPASLSHKIITDLLKEEMGFEGIVCTDALNMTGITGYYDPIQAVKLAINAGADLLCMPYELRNKESMIEFDRIIAEVEHAVEIGEIEESRLNDAVYRILKVKENRGILDYTESLYSSEDALATVGSDKNKQAEREIAASAVTVVRNEDDLLPLRLSEEQKVLIISSKKELEESMVTGWNRGKEEGTVLNSAVMKEVLLTEQYMEDLKEDLDWADILIICSNISDIGILNNNSEDHWMYQGVEDIVNYAKENNKKSIVISVNKPYDVQFYQNANAVIAVYGNRSMDNGGAFMPNATAGIEVIFGTFKAVGRLPVDIPEYDIIDKVFTDDIVYTRGYGITYQ